MGEILKSRKKRLIHLNIGRKMFLGYLTLSALTFLCAFFSLHYLEKLNDINQGIIEKDIPLVQTAENMVENLYAQEIYGNRYMILKNSTMMELFLDRIREFQEYVKSIHTILAKKGMGIQQIKTTHEEYNALFLQWFRSQDNPVSDGVDYERLVSEKQKELITLIQNISQKINQTQNQKIMATSIIGIKAFRIIGFICILSVIFSIGAAVLITRKISDPITRLKKATTELTRGDFDPGKLGDLADSFKKTAKELTRLQDKYLDANPLTHLAGGIAIEKDLKRRLDSGSPIAFCLLDLDHFKAFNDHYGYARGNEVIKHTALIVEETVGKFGSPGDFIGHIGGDDFVILSTIKHYKKICEHIMKTFDKKITSFYERDDIDKGFIKVKSRLGRSKKFPLLSISIAVVTNKNHRFSHHIQVSEIAAELKSYAKTIPHSFLIVDRRRRQT